MTPVSIPNDLIDWLLAGDVAIQYQVHRDLLGEDAPTCGRRHCKSRAGVNSSWPRLAGPRPLGKGFYQPKWISTHYTLLDLKHLGIAPAHTQIHTRASARSWRSTSQRTAASPRQRPSRTAMSA